MKIQHKHQRAIPAIQHQNTPLNFHNLPQHMNARMLATLFTDVEMLEDQVEPTVVKDVKRLSFAGKKR